LKFLNAIDQVEEDGLESEVASLEMQRSSLESTEELEKDQGDLRYFFIVLFTVCIKLD
jgi:hypothetical protein